MGAEDNKNIFVSNCFFHTLYLDTTWKPRIKDDFNNWMTSYNTVEQNHFENSCHQIEVRALIQYKEAILYI